MSTSYIIHRVVQASWVMYLGVMEHTPLPEDWELDGWTYSPKGCLRIILTDPVSSVHCVTWHTDDRVSVVSSDRALRVLRFDPIAVALALTIASEHELSPRYPGQTGPWN